MPGSLCNYSVNPKTDSKTLYYWIQFTEIKIYSFCCQAQQRLKEICAIKQQPQNTIFYKIIFRLITWSLHPTGHMSQIILWDFYVSETQVAEVTKSLRWLILIRIIPKEHTHTASRVDNDQYFMFYTTTSHEKFLQYDWPRAVVFQLNLKYLHVKVTKLLQEVA